MQESSPTVCPTCSTPIRANAKYCAACGAPLRALSPPSPSPTDANRVVPKLPKRIAGYQVRGAWEHDAAIVTLTRQGAGDKFLALPLAERWQDARVQQLVTLTQPRGADAPNPFCRVIGQAQDDHKHFYLVVDAPRGVRLDQLLVPLQGARAFALYAQLRAILIELQQQGWVSAIRLPRPKGWARSLDKIPYAEHFGRMSDTMRARFETESFERFRRGFMLDETDTLRVFDYTAWDALGNDGENQTHRQERDQILATRVMYWLFSGKSLGREIEQLKATPGAISQIVIHVFTNLPAAPEKIDELLSQTMPRKKSHLPAPPPAITTMLPSGVLTTKLGITLKGFGATDPGVTRANNEDSMLLVPLGESNTAGFYVVADGLGGHADGKFASEQVIQSLETSARGEWEALQNAASEEIHAALTKWITRANQRVLDAAYARSNDMGSTVTAALVFGARAFVANVGDSRTYLWRAGQLYPISRDHSLVASLVAANLLNEEDIYTHPQRNQVFRSLGMEANVNVDVFEQALGEGDGLLLCSDGLWEMVRKPALERVLQDDPDWETAAKTLVGLANENGGEDNITVVLVRRS